MYGFFITYRSELQLCNGNSPLSTHDMHGSCYNSSETMDKAAELWQILALAAAIASGLANTANGLQWLRL